MGVQPPKSPSIVEKIYDTTIALANRVVSPETRAKSWENVSGFARENPLVFSFLALQILASTFPILLFLAFCAGAIAVAAISAVLFTLFWIGVALLVLLPTLFVTISLGCFAWAWALVSFVVARYVYRSVWGEEGSQALVRVKNGSAEVWEGKNEKVNEVVEKVKEVILSCEDVDCVGMMGGGMELGCG
ncbi:hypothetical protein GLAREA_11887 [Glarea lozoyensis ATCC 20868]|uniref:Uncharacterized protein n=1 Tax=Glarea lozoyensis (strain ATCC 20868 / MF5171) TaxID=1116229 RepID=S3D1Z0_GLAL2|nr:uncharacterized protein GLAREA_11887 [Glarea lozoyensis ATCC 20868]EPE31805.1 hypothetical protein GLAREA_11887 [Glarea lozoyensis ATCC 20868]